MLIPKDRSNEIYEARVRETLDYLKAQGLTKTAFGDLFLEGVKHYRDGLWVKPVRKASTRPMEARHPGARANLYQLEFWAILVIAKRGKRSCAPGDSTTVTLCRHNCR